VFRVSKERLLVLGVWLALVVTNPGRNETNDVGMREMIARRLWTSGKVTLTEIPPSQAQLPWVPTGHGTWAAPYGVGESLVFIPFDVVGAALERLAPASWRERIGWFPIGLGLLPLLGVCCWLTMRRVLEQEGLEPSWALAGSLAITFGTYLFHYMGQGQEEILVGFFLILSVSFALRLRAAPKLTSAMASGALAGACLITRPISVFSLLIVPFLLWSAAHDAKTRARIFAAAGAALGAALGVVLLYNYARFGNPFTVGYDRLGHFTKIALDHRSPGIVFSLLLGPGFGLFVLSPLLVFALWGLAPLWRLDRFYALGLGVAVTACYVFFSAWHDSYSGGVAWGTRYQCHVLPLYALPLTLGLRRLVTGRRWRPAVLALASVSLAIQLLSVVVTHHLEYLESTCATGDFVEEPLASSFREGQLAKRVENLTRWITKAGPPPCAHDPGLAAVWDRYIPNFWGPVIAHRLPRGPSLAVLSLWSACLLAAASAIALGLRGLGDELWSTPVVPVDRADLASASKASSGNA
jgi:hypothetical protein